MLLEILHTYLRYLFLALVALSYEQAFADDVTCERSCRVNSTIVCLLFFENKTDLHGAKDRCKFNATILLTESTYDGNSTCFNKYLQETHALSAWLDPENTTVRYDIVKAFNTSRSFEANIEADKHSVVCTSTGSTESLSQTNRIESTSQNPSATHKSTTGNGDPTAFGLARSTQLTKDNSANNEKNPSGKDQHDHWDVAIPVALATAAIVMSICCITCIVCGIILFRKKEKIIKSIRTTNTTVDSPASALDAVELRSTVNVYANINQQKRNSEKQQRESRFLNDSERVHMNNDIEIYSTVDTENAYSNMESILRDHNTDELYSCCDESPMYREYYNMATSNPRPPDYAVCAGGSDNESRKGSGRYISDGLLYVTPALDARARKARPVKAKSEEHVEYLRIDFDKTAKMYKKKHRSLSRGKTKGVLALI